MPHLPVDLERLNSEIRPSKKGKGPGLARPLRDEARRRDTRMAGSRVSLYQANVQLFSQNPLLSLSGESLSIQRFELLTRHLLNEAAFRVAL